MKLDHSNIIRRLPVGAEVQPEGGVHFRVWAPKRRGVEVTVESDDPPRSVALEAEGNGYFAGFVADICAGARYRYRLDGGDSFPDPASRFQPEGPHGPSRVVDPSAFAWTDQNWRGLALPGQVLYEMHIGTFTPEGTWAAAIERLPRLAELGVTAVEPMPAAEFAGAFGWGYDGVDLFAPHHGYGDPDDMRRFVNEAHGLGMGVVLDVVYNHFGPDGCYVGQFSDDYVHRSRPNDWGDSINFDGENSGPVREFFIANAGYWIDEFHVDGLRLDATQAIHDSSTPHILKLINRRAREAAGGRSILIFAENEPQNVRLTRPEDEGGHGLDGAWNDDFHHAARVALTGRAEAYYADYEGTPQELISAVKWGFLFQGQVVKWQRKRRGTPTFDAPAARFATYLESHDQVANSTRGRRLKSLTSPGEYRAMIALWLTAPQTPMIFQGMELGSDRPFFYFSNHNEELARLVSEGRREELAAFRSTIHPAIREVLADPSGEATFLDSKLREPVDYRLVPEFLLIQDLLKLRRDDPIFRAQDSSKIQGAVIGPRALALRYFGEADDSRLVVVNLGRDLYPTPNTEPLLAPPAGMDWSVLWFSEHPRYDGVGVPPISPGLPWRAPGRSALILAPTPADDRPEDPAMGSAPSVDFDVHPSLRRN